MLMKCRTGAKELIPPRKNIINCPKCIIKKRKTSQKKNTLKKNQKVNKMMKNKMKVMNKMRMKKAKNRASAT